MNNRETKEHVGRVNRLHTLALHGGLTHCRLDTASFDLGGGLMLSKTFAHFMSPFMLAFAPAEPGQPHPAPWSAVAGGIAYDMHVQLRVPPLMELPEEFFDNVNTIWFVVALLRLHSGAPIQVPVIAERPYSEIPEALERALTVPIETELETRWAPSSKRGIALPLETLEWVRAHWLAIGQLLRKERRLNDAFQAFDQAPTLRSTAIALLVLWGALEHLFSRERREVTFRMAGYVAAYLEPFGPRRRSLQRRVVKLYDARSEAAHGAGADVPEAFVETLELLRRILVKIFTTGNVPKREDLDDLVYGERDDPKR